MSRRIAKFCFAFPLFVLISLPSFVAADSPGEESHGLRRLREKGAALKEVGDVVVELKVDCSDLTDSDYIFIGSMKTLQSISISGKPMLDRHLEMLSGLSQLESFQINGTQLTDDGYRHFGAFPNLRRLSLFHPSRDVAGFTGAGLEHLKSMPKLRRLTFAGATAGDEAFDAVGKLTQLDEFSQWHNWESPDAVKSLVGLKLKSLKMGQRLPNWRDDRPPSLSDATLAEIARMRSLETIELQEARLTLKGLMQLKSLPNLRTLKLKWIDVSESEISELKQSMPGVTVQWEPLTDDDERNLLVKKLKL